MKALINPGHCGYKLTSEHPHCECKLTAGLKLMSIYVVHKLQHWENKCAYIIRQAMQELKD